MKNALLASNFNRVSKKSYVGVNHGFITYELTDKMKRWVLVARFRGCYLPQITIFFRLLYVLLAVRKSWSQICHSCILKEKLH